VKRLSDQTLYEIIEVSVDASAEEIARSCDRAAAAYGPGSLATYTLASSEETALLSSRIEEARAVLLDASARARYDERIGVRPPMPAPGQVPGPEPEPDGRASPPPVHLPPHATWPPPEPEPVTTESRPVSPGLPAMTPPPAPAPSLEQGAESAASPAEPPRPPAAPPPIPLTLPVAPSPISLTRPVAPILLDREVRAPRPPEPPEGGAWTGEMLRRVRESRGLTVQQLAEKTRVTRHHLENIELDRFKALPAPVYLRGILMSLARELRLDGQKVARAYLDRMGTIGEAEPKR
jgi:curved DNA-binding protein CbpA